MKTTKVAAAPKLPDVRACCVSAGVNHYGCIDKLCDPTKTFEIAVSFTIVLREILCILFIALFLPYNDNQYKNVLLFKKIRRMLRVALDWLKCVISFIRLYLHKHRYHQRLH